MPIEKEIKWYPEEERECLEKKYASHNEGSFSNLVFEEKFEPYDDINWIKASDRLPNKNGKYLVVYEYFGRRSIDVARFSTNLHKVDKYIFDTEKRPGWYESDSEVGYFERTSITHWAELPELPSD
jgi:hypothetical protein